eukprot:11211260-Lingulodinium_polyedra.AAC.1
MAARRAVLPEECKLAPRSCPLAPLFGASILDDVWAVFAGKDAPAQSAAANWLPAFGAERARV